MGDVIDLLAFRRAQGKPLQVQDVPELAPEAKAGSAAKPKPSAEPSARGSRLHRTTRQGRGRHVPPIRLTESQKSAFLDLLSFQMSTNIVVDEHDRDYLADPAEHERARAFFEAFGFDIDAIENAEAMWELWSALDAEYTYFVKMVLDNPNSFCTMTLGEPEVWFQYVVAVASQDLDEAKRLSHIVHDAHLYRK